VRTASLPPSSAFADPKLAGFTPARIVGDGLIQGHLWHTDDLAGDTFDVFRTWQVTCRGGRFARAGPVYLGLCSPGAEIGLVNAGWDDHGLWIAGAAHRCTREVLSVLIDEPLFLWVAHFRDDRPRLTSVVVFPAGPAVSSEDVRLALLGRS